MTWMTFLRIIELAFDGFSVETDLVKEFRNMVGNFLYIISSLFSMNLLEIDLQCQFIELFNQLLQFKNLDIHIDNVSTFGY